MFAEESLETHLLHAQEPGEIPPQEPAAAASWLGMLRPGFATAQCFRCLGKRPPSLAEHLTSAGAQPQHPGCQRDQPLRCLLPQFPYIQTPHFILLGMLTALLFFFPPKHFKSSAGKKKKRVTSVPRLGPLTQPYLRGLFLITAGPILPSPPGPACPSQVLLLSTVPLRTPSPNTKPEERLNPQISGPVLPSPHRFLLVYRRIDGGGIELLLSKWG